MSIANVKVFYAAGLLAGSQAARGMDARAPAVSERRAPAVPGRRAPAGAPSDGQTWREEKAAGLKEVLLNAAKSTKQNELERSWGVLRRWKRIGWTYYENYAANVQYALRDFLGRDFVNYTLESDMTSARIYPISQPYTIQGDFASSVYMDWAEPEDLDPLLAALYELAIPSAHSQMTRALKNLILVKKFPNVFVAEVNLSRFSTHGRYFVEFVVRGERPAESEDGSPVAVQYRMQVSIDTSFNRVNLEKVYQKKGDTK